MSTFALDSNNDLYFSNKKLTIISGSNTDEEIVQRLRVRLKFFKDEWFLNSEHGLPYFEDILGNKNLDLNIIESILREQILNIEGIREIVESSIDYDENKREVHYLISIVSINNSVITENLVVL
jgi:hypothetical protein